MLRSALRLTVAIAAMAIVPSACGLAVPSARPNASAEPTSTFAATRAPETAALATATPTPTITADLLAAPGAIVIARMEPASGTGRKRLWVTVVRPGKPPVSGGFVFGPSEYWVSGWGNGGETGSIRITADGWAALEGAGGGVIMVDLFGHGGISDSIRGSGPSVLPDGTVVVTRQDQVDGVPGMAEVVRRVANHGFGEISDTVVTGRIGAAFPLRYIVHGDLSGIEGGVDGKGWTGVTLHWDGTVVKRRPSDLPYLELGAERSGGVNGERILGCDGWGPCPLEWRRPDGKVLRHPGIALENAWTRGGQAVVMLDLGEPNVDGDMRVLLVRDTARGLKAAPLGLLASGEDAAGLFFLTGMSSWAAVLERDLDLHVNVIPLDGSPVLGPFKGTLALVNP